MANVRGVTLLAICGVALSACAGGQDGRSAVSTDSARLAELRRVDPEASRLVEGGRAELQRRLRRARGTPLVVNQWASWCGPCRAEFPIFQRLALRSRGRVAFLGVNSKDSLDDARDFLRQHPTPFAHVRDPDASAARLFHGGRSWPTTAFYDASGRLRYTHQGQYATDADLDRDIRRYAIGD